MGFIASIKKKASGKKTKKKTLKFTTTLQCGGCIKKVSPHLDAIDGIYSWDVKLNSVNKILKAEVDPERVDEIKQAIVKALEKEEYSAKPVN